METQYRFRCGWICGNSYTLSRTSQAIFHDFSASNATDPARMIAHNEDYQMVRTSAPRRPPSLHINNNPRRSSALHKSHDDNLSRILLNCMSKAWYTQIRFGTFDAAFLPNRKGESKIQRHIFSFALPFPCNLIRAQTATVYLVAQGSMGSLGRRSLNYCSKTRVEADLWIN